MNRRQRRRRAQLRRALCAGPVLLGAIWLVVGLGLPAGHREEAQVVVPGSPETVWAVLMDLDAMPSWRDDVTAVERLPDAGGAVRWLEVGRDGPLPLERIEAIPPELLVVRSLASGARSRQWTYRITPATGGVMVTVVEERRLPPVERPLAAVLGFDRGRIEAVARGLVGRVVDWRRVAVEGAGRRSG